MSLGEESTTDTLGNLQGKGDKFTKLAIIERKKLADLEDAILYVMKETDRYRDLAKKSAIEVMNLHVLTPNPAYSRADGVNIGKEAQIVTAKSLVVLEGKVNKQLQRKSELLNKIKKMKETINHFRLLRLQTDVSHAKFEATLAETKEKIESLLGESTKVVEEREELVKKKEALERLNQEEQAQFIQEYEEMGKYIKEQNTALEEALLQERKAERKGGAAAAPKAVKSSDPFDSAPTVSDLSLEEEIEMARKVGSLTSYVQAEQNSLSELRDKIFAYERMFDQLKSMTGVESLEEMVSNYIAHEEEMFSLYNFIQTVNTEIDTVVEATNQTEDEIAQYRLDQQDQDQQRRSTIDELQQRLSSTLDLTRNLDEQNSLQQESVAQISKKVSTLFFKLQCDQMEAKGSQVNNAKNQRWASGSRPENKIALLTGQGVTDSNVVDYLGCIEQRAVDIISDYLRVTGGKPSGGTGINKFTGGGARSPTPGPSTPMNWRKSREPLVDLAELSDDEFMLEGPADKATTTEVGNNNTTEGPAGTSSGGNLFGASGGTGTEGINGTSAPNTTTAAGAAAGNGAAAGAAAAAENDNKPIDLNVYKAKLQRRLGLKESASSGTIMFVGQR